MQAAGAVGVSELADAFGVSHETIRRDLKHLADQGRLDVVHGGAARHGLMEPAIAQRLTENPDGKAAIARLAVAMVPEGGTVLLDSGSTTGAICRELVKRSSLTICTNSLAHGALLCRIPGLRVVMLGGEVDVNDEATFGLGAVTGLDTVRVDIAFIGCGGFAEDGGLTDYTALAADLRARMIETGRAFVVADHGKFGRRTAFRVPNFDRLAGVIVDRHPPDGLAAAWAAKGISVHAPE